MFNLNSVYLQLAWVVRESIVNGLGIRYTIFTQGCHHNCFGCHNPETHSPTGGYKISVEKILKDIDEDPILDG